MLRGRLTVPLGVAVGCILAAGLVLTVEAVNPNGVNRFWYNSHGHSCTYNGQLNVEPPYDETTNYIVDDYPYDPCEGTTKFFVWSGSSYVCYPASMCSSALWHNVGFTQWQNDYDTDRGYGYYQQRELPYWDSTQEVFASE